ncbi:MAG: hypothetical protein QOH21_2366 [Acidobacteriota bacterium]|nr:hypothetical protein [Acidobacteriota bacterium]
MDLAATLRRLGYEIAGMVGTGAAAINAAAAHAPDLILMDIRLKGKMDGIEAAAIIQRQQRRPIIFLTAHGDADTVERAKAASPYGYLVKPFDERSLHRIVEISLHRSAADKEAHDAALDALWKSEERFRLLVQAVKDYSIFMVDLDGRIVSWNPGAERMTGYSEAEVLGQPVTILRPPAQRDPRHLARLLTEVLEKGGAEWDEAWLKKDGSTYLPHIYCTPMFDRAGTVIGYVSVTRDVTEQRKLEAQLLQTQRLESLGHLAGGVAHDFNNMLMVIFARCEALLRSHPSERDRQFIKDIRSAATKNRDLTQQLLAAARQQVLEPQVVDVNDVVRSAVRLLSLTLGENIVIEEELDQSLWNVSADPGKLHQVLLNLAINARDAMPSGGRLTIETRNVKVDARYARQHLGMDQGDYVSIVVTDTGSGIPREIMERIFDPFFTTKAPGRGTGLGLAVVLGIVEQTGGRTWVYSEEGHGTTFKIFLPRHHGEVRRETAAEETPVEGGAETILLVEDEDLLREVVCEALIEQGYRLLQARTPAEALAISDSFAEPIHLLLTDMIMPGGMTGKELATHIAERRPNTRIILMSGYSNHTITNHTLLKPGMRYLEKPVPTNLLLRTIREALAEAPRDPPSPVEPPDPNRPPRPRAHRLVRTDDGRGASGAQASRPTCRKHCTRRPPPSQP